VKEDQQYIPTSWTSKDLGSLIIEQLKSKIKVSGAANFGPYPFFTSGEAVLKHTDKEVDGKNIFLATGGLANVKYHNGAASYSTDTYAVTTNGSIDTEYLYYNLCRIIEYVNTNYFEGSGLKHLQKKEFKEHKIIFPKSNKEQRKIIQGLNKVDAAIVETEALIAKHHRVKSGLMQDLLSKGIDKNFKIRSELSHEFKDSALGRIPKEWSVEKAGDLFEMILGKMLNRAAKVGTDQFEYLGNRNVLWGDFDLTGLEKMSFNKNEREKFRLLAGDLLVCEGGEVGRSAIWQGDKQNVFFQKAIHRVRPKSKRICTSYMLEYMIFFVSKSLFNDYVSQTSIKHFTQEKFKQIPVLVPLEDEQERIVLVLNKQIEIIKIEKENLKKLLGIKAGLSQDLLTGKVRVTKLIKDEPATV
jgi:type I restriction enzyme S subunit